MAQPPETRLTHRIKDAIRWRYPDAWVFKVSGNPMQRGGVPDLLVCLSGHLVGLEVKCQQPGETREHARGRATVRQRVELAALERAGGRGAVVTSVEEALEVLAQTQVS